MSLAVAILFSFLLFCFYFHGKASVKSVPKLSVDQLHPQGLSAATLGFSTLKRILIHLKLQLLFLFKKKIEEKHLLIFS